MHFGHFYRFHFLSCFLRCTFYFMSIQWHILWLINFQLKRSNSCNKFRKSHVNICSVRMRHRNLYLWCKSIGQKENMNTLVCDMHIGREIECKHTLAIRLAVSVSALVSMLARRSKEMHFGLLLIYQHCPKPKIPTWYVKLNGRCFGVFFISLLVLLVLLCLQFTFLDAVVYCPNNLCNKNRTPF